MHRHGYKGTKFGRQRDQRRALLKSLADSLILHEEIETTLPKAKEVASYTERLITKAKKGDLHNRRQVIMGLMTIEAAHKLVDELSPRLLGRKSGYLRVVRTTVRRGDDAQMARVSFVDDLAKKAPKIEPVKSASKESDKGQPKDAQTNKKVVLPKVDAGTSGKISTAHTAAQAAKRTGRRGNR